MMTTPNAITIAQLEVLVMPHGEVLCAGRPIGWTSSLGEYLTPVRVAEQTPKSPK